MNGDTESGDWRADAARLVARLIESIGQKREHAAADLAALGVRARGSVRTRGSVTAAASDRLSERQLDQIAACLRDEKKEVRAHVARALGEWGGEDAAR